MRPLQTALAAEIPMADPIRNRRFWRRISWVAVARRTTRLTSGAVLGLLATIVLLLTVEMLARALRQHSMTSRLGGAAVLVPWGLAATVLVYRATALSTVFARACLLGAAQWIALIPIAFLLASAAVPANSTQAHVVEYQMKLILVSSALAMAALCLSGYAAIAVSRRAWRRLVRSQFRPDA